MARGRARLTALVLSGAFHTAVLGWLLMGQHRFPPAVEPPAMVVTLVSPFARPPPPAPPRARRAAAARPAQPTLAAPETSPPQPVFVPPVAAPDEASRLRNALQAMAGCERLAGEARRRCEDRREARMAQERTLPAPKLVLDRRGDFATNPEPYLTRKPKNGCKARAAGAAPGPLGVNGAVAGINCAWQF